MYISIWVHLLLENNRQEFVFSTALLLIAKRYQKAPIPQPIRKKLHILLFSKCGLGELQLRKFKTGGYGKQSVDFFNAVRKPSMLQF